MLLQGVVSFRHSFDWLEDWFENFKCSWSRQLDGGSANAESANALPAQK